MNKKVKILSAALALVGVLALGTKSVLGSSDKNSTLDVNDIIRLTTSNNSELNLFKNRIEVKEKWYSENLKTDKNDSNFQEDMKEYVTPLRRKHEIKEIQWQRDQKQDELVLASTKAYYEIILQNKMIKVQEKKIERLTKLLEYKKQKIDVGTDAAVTLIDDETALKDAKVKLQQLKNDEERFRMELNMKIGNPVDKKLNLKESEVPYKVFEVKNLENTVDIMLKKYHTITSIIEEEDIDARERALVHSYANANDKSELENVMNPKGDYKEREEELEDHIIELRYKIDDEKKNIEAKIRMDYNNILNLKADVEARGLDCDKANTLLNTEKKKLEVGRSTQIECDAAEENLLMAKYQYDKAKLNYYVAVEDFKNFTKRVK